MVGRAVLRAPRAPVDSGEFASACFVEHGRHPLPAFHSKGRSGRLPHTVAADWLPAVRRQAGANVPILRAGRGHSVRSGYRSRRRRLGELTPEDGQARRGQRRCESTRPAALRAGIIGAALKMHPRSAAPCSKPPSCPAVVKKSKHRGAHRAGAFTVWRCWPLCRLRRFIGMPSNENRLRLRLRRRAEMRGSRPSGDLPRMDAAASAAVVERNELKPTQGE